METRANSSSDSGSNRRRLVNRKRTGNSGSIRDGVLIALLAHLVAITWGSIAFGPLAALPFAWLLLGIVQVFYMAPLALLLALTGRVATLLGLLLVAGLTWAPILVIRASGGIKVMPGF